MQAAASQPTVSPQNQHLEQIESQITSFFGSSDSSKNTSDRFLILSKVERYAIENGWKMLVDRKIQCIECEKKIDYSIFCAHYWEKNTVQLKQAHTPDCRYLTKAKKPNHDINTKSEINKQLDSLVKDRKIDLSTLPPREKGDQQQITAQHLPTSSLSNSEVQAQQLAASLAAAIIEDKNTVESYNTAENPSSQNTVIQPPEENESKPKHPGFATPQARTNTYTDWPAPLNQKPEGLVKAGFFYEGHGDTVRCFQCGQGLNKWEPKDDPIIEHARWYPDCFFMRTLMGEEFISDALAGTIINSGQSGDPQIDTEITSTPAFLAVKQMGDYTADQIIKTIKLLKKTNEDSTASSIYMALMKNEASEDIPTVTPPNSQQSRASTPESTAENESSQRNHIPTSSLSNSEVLEQQLAAANIEDKNTVKRYNTAENQSSQNTVTQPPPEESACPSYIESQGVIESKARYPQLATPQVRTRTYRNWPPHLNQKPEILVEAGLFYEGEKDYVRCFYCAGGMREWEPYDDPFIEHAKWFPFCAYMTKLKGNRFIEGVQRGTIKSVQSGDQQVTAQNSDVECTQTSLQPSKHGEKPDEKHVLHVKNEQLHQQYTGITNTSAFLAVQQMGNYTADQIIKTIKLLKKTNEDSDARSILSVLMDEDTLKDNPTVTPPNSQQSRASTPESTGTSHQVQGAQGDTNTNPQNAAVSQQTRIASLEKQAELLQDENQKLKDEKLCKVCFEENATILLSPCGHLVTCETCTESLNKQCPICRIWFDASVKAYL